MEKSGVETVPCPGRIDGVDGKAGFESNLPVPQQGRSAGSQFQRHATKTRVRKPAEYLFRVRLTGRAITGSAIIGDAAAFRLIWKEEVQQWQNRAQACIPKPGFVPSHIQRDCAAV